MSKASLKIGMRVEWTERDTFGSFRHRGCVMGVQVGRVKVRRDGGGVTMLSVSKLRPLTAHDLAIEQWVERRPRGLAGRQRVMIVEPGIDDPGDITLRIPFRLSLIETVTVADLDAILADVTAIREWLASRPGPTP